MIGIYGRATDYLLTHSKAQTMRNKVTLAEELGTICTTNLPSTVVLVVPTPPHFLALYRIPAYHLHIY